MRAYDPETKDGCLDDWTPRIGWQKAAVRIPIRLAIALGFAWAGFWLLHLLICWVEGQINMTLNVIGMGLIAFFGVVAGVSGGFVMSWRLSADTGLLGTHIFWPVCGLLVAGLCVLHYITAAFFPAWGTVSFYLFGITGIAACALLAKQLLIDS